MLVNEIPTLVTHLRMFVNELPTVIAVFQMLVNINPALVPRLQMLLHEIPTLIEVIQRLFIALILRLFHVNQLCCHSTNVHGRRVGLLKQCTLQQNWHCDENLCPQ